MSRPSQQQTIVVAVAIVLAIALAASVADAAVLRTKRDVDESSTNENRVKVCHASTPCGWAVYVPFSRRIDYFMRNTCECPKDKTCMRTDDDLSVSAYVYRCMTSTDTDTSS